MNLPNTKLTNEMTLLDMMWYPKGCTTLKPIEVVISSGLGEKHLIKQMSWSTFQTAINYLIHQAEITAFKSGYDLCAMENNIFKVNRISKEALEKDIV